MGLFDFLSNMTHPDQKNGWVETEAFFTGKCERAARGKSGHYVWTDYNEYEIRYYTADAEITGWYVFHPLPDPDPEAIKDTSIRIRYNEDKPWEFEAISSCQ